MPEPTDFSRAMRWLGSVPGGFFVYEARGEEKVVHVNDRVLAIYGCETEEEFMVLTGGTFRGMVHPDDYEAVERSIWKQVEREDTNFDHIEYRIVTKSGDISFIDDYGQYVPAGDGFPEQFVVFATDSDMRSYNYADDRVTGLLGMRSFLELVHERRLDGDPNRSIVYVDIQDFKSYNAAHGVEAGDAALVRVAGAIAEAFPGSPVARFSDDHFVVCSECVDVEDRVRAAAESVHSGSGALSLKIKAGIRKLADADPLVPVSRLCDQAKTACDEVKPVSGSILLEYSEELDRHIELRRHVVDNIERALEEGWVEIHFQPVVRALTGKVCGLEALARWNDPEHGPISPAFFVPALERAKLIHRLDGFVAGAVCRQIRLRLDAWGTCVPVSFNLSRVDFELTDPFESLEGAARKYRIPRDLLKVEITESTLMSDPGRISEQMTKFQAAGYEVWMDDFGSGQSSLNVLKDHRFDEIKLDMLFLSNLDERGREIVAATVSMAKKIGVKTLAEGVETREQFDFLRSIGCDKIQGYFFGRPMGVSALAQHVRDRGMAEESRPEAAMLDKVGRIDVAVEHPVLMPI